MERFERVSSTPGDNRSGGSRASWCGFSFPVQHFGAVRHAVAEFHERRDEQRKSLRERRILDGEGARDVLGALSVSGIRQIGREHFDGISEVDEASYPGRVLRRDGAERGAVQTDERADPDDYGSL